MKYIIIVFIILSILSQGFIYGYLQIKISTLNDKVNDISVDEFKDVNSRLYSIEQYITSKKCKENGGILRHGTFEEMASNYPNGTGFISSYTFPLICEIKGKVYKIDGIKLVSDEHKEI